MSSLPTNFNTLDRSLRPTRRLAARLLPATGTVVYECPKQRTATLTTIVISNVSAGSSDFTLHHAIPAESAVTSNAIMYAVRISANSTTAIEFPITLCAGDRLIALGSVASSICVLVYGTEA